MRISSFIREKWVFTSLILLALLALGILLWLSQYIHPAADDYGYALRDTQRGFWAIQKETYLNWSGRYFGTAILQLNPLRFGSFAGYRLVSFLMIIGFAAGIYLVVEELFKATWPTSNRKAFAALLFLLYLVQCPSLPEAFYWLTGTLGYTLSCLLFLLMLVFLHKVGLTDATGEKTVYTEFATLLAIMAIGSNEMALLMVISSVAMIGVYHWLQNTTSKFHLLTILVICSVAAMMMILAPGNFVRMGAEAKSQNLFWSVAYASGLTMVAFVKWAVPLLIGSLVYILYIFPRQTANSPTSKRFTVDLRLVGFFYLATLFAMHFLFVWSTGERPTPRLENMIYFYLLLGWFFLLQALLVRYQLGTASLPLAFHKLVPAIAILLFILHVLAQQNPITTAFTDLITGTAARYDKEMQARYKTLGTSNCQTCALPPLTKVPASITFIDIATKEDTLNGWVNIGTAAYWKKDSIYLSQPNPPMQNNQDSLVEWSKSLLLK